MRAVWICTAFNLDWPSKCTLSVDDQKKELITLLNYCEELHINTVFLQIRAAADAFYKSKTEPWSYWLTGEQGKSPDNDFDPLKFAIDECHKRNIELHAWLNLFRAVSHTKFFVPYKDHVTRKHKNWTYKMNSSLFFNPGVPEVRTYLLGVVAEVVANYDIDGVHLDDYFYHQESPKNRINDEYLYKKEKGKFANKGDWRRNNVNLIIHQLSDTIKTIKPFVKFGISPAPVWRHIEKDSLGSMSERALTSYDDLYADSRKWVKEGWIDYIMPQLYWSNRHSSVGFEKMLKWWSRNKFDRHLYIGLAYYKINNDKDLAWKNPKEFPYQIRTCQNTDSICGEGFYRAQNLHTNNLGIKDSLLNSYYKYRALPPTMPWIDSIPPHAPTELRYADIEDWTALKWTPSVEAVDGDTAYVYNVYRFAPEDHISLSIKHLVATTPKTEYIDKAAAHARDYVYIITAMDRIKNESTNFIGIYRAKD